MNNQADIEIVPEDRVKLTNDQKNLIALALEKQLPIEDAEFLENIQKKGVNPTDSFVKIEKYFVTKYGLEFGKIYLAAITDGEDSCKAAINELETARAQERIKGKRRN